MLDFKQFKYSYINFLLAKTRLSCVGELKGRRYGTESMWEGDTPAGDTIFHSCCLPVLVRAGPYLYHRHMPLPITSGGVVGVRSIPHTPLK